MKEAQAAAAASTDLAKAGNVAQAMDVCLAFSSSVEPSLLSATSRVLELAAARGEPQHARAAALWRSLEERSGVDARACNAWFSLALRGGQLKAAMAAYRHAEREGLAQSLQMRNYIRSVRRYKESLRSKC